VRQASGCVFAGGMVVCAGSGVPKGFSFAVPDRRVPAAPGDRPNRPLRTDHSYNPSP
jgi:hypothetical protein